MNYIHQGVGESISITKSRGLNVMFACGFGHADRAQTLVRNSIRAIAAPPSPKLPNGLVTHTCPDRTRVSPSSW